MTSPNLRSEVNPGSGAMPSMHGETSTDVMAHRPTWGGPATGTRYSAKGSAAPWALIASVASECSRSPVVTGRHVLSYDTIVGYPEHGNAKLTEGVCYACDLGAMVRIVGERDACACVATRDDP